MGFSLNPLHDIKEAANDVAGGVSTAVTHVAHDIGNDVVQPALRDIAAPITDALQKPEGYVQHYYRYVHDRWTRYGVLSGLEAIPGQWGGSLNHLPGPLDYLGAPARFIQSHLPGGISATQDTESWNMTRNGAEYRDIHGNAVNPGYDVANVLDNLVNQHDYMPTGWTRNAKGVMEPTKGGGVDFWTGAVNAAFDLSTDPTLKAGKALKAIKEGGLILRGSRSGAVIASLSDDAGERAAQLKKLSDSGVPLQVTANGRAVVIGGRVLVAPRVPTLLAKGGGWNASDIPMILKNNAGVRSTFEHLATLDSAEKVFSAYPAIGPTTLAAQIAKAKTAEEVGRVFEDALTTENYKFGPNGLPSTGLVRRVAASGGLELPTLGQVSNAIGDSNPLFRKASSYRATVFDHATLKKSEGVFNPNDPNFPRAFRDTLLAAGHSKRVANAITGAYIDTPELGARINMISHMMIDSLRTAGVADDHKLITQYGKVIHFLNSNSLRRVYGMDREGNPLFVTDEATGEPQDLGLFGNQVGKIALPNFNEIRKAVAETKGGLGGALVKGDDWLYNTYTGKFFKGLVLLSLGFPVRVATGEITPAILANSAREFAGGALEGAAARLNPTFKELANEVGPDAFIDHRAEVKVPHPETGKTVDRVGRISKVDPEAGTVTVDHRDGSSFTHAMGDVTIVQKELRDSHIMDAARELGIEVETRELPHYRAALGMALHRVGRALVDDTYRDFALRSLISHEGHILPSAVASNHDVASSMAGRIEDLKDQYKQAGAQYPEKPSVLSGTDWRFYDAGVANHPVFWHHAISEVSKEEGARASAKAYLDTYRDHIKTPTEFEIQERGNRGQIVVATRSGHLRGSLQFEHEGNALKVGFSSVADEAQGERVHSAMREALYKHAAERGLDVIHPEVVNENLLKSYSKDKRLIRTSDNSFRKPAALADVKDPARVAAEGAADRAFNKADLEWMRTGTSDEAQRFREDMALYQKNPIAMSEGRREAIKGLAYGQNGQLNEDVLAAIAGDRNVPTIGALASRKPEFRPLRVKGREVEEVQRANTIDKWTQRGWRAMHPIINQLSRQPIYTMLGAQEFKRFEQAIKLGTMDVATAHRLAEIRAINRMLPLIHNPQMRSQFADLSRNFFPFFYAQEQAYKRYGRAVFSSPLAFRKAVLATHAISNSGVMRADAQGNQSVVLPGGTMYGRWVTAAAQGFGLNVMAGLPSTISGNTISLKSVVPEGNLPSVSPLVAIGLEQVQHFFPASEPLLSKVIGPINASQSVTDQLIPNASLKRVLQATVLADRSTAFATAFMQNMAAAQYRSNVLNARADRAEANGDTALAKKYRLEADKWFPAATDDPGIKQQAIDRLRNTTRIQMLVKTAVGAVSPLSPTMDNGDLTLQNEVRQILSSKNGIAGLDDFISKHPNATPYTVFQSDNTQTGTSLPATRDAYDWVTKNQGWIKNNKYAAAYLIPQTSQPYDVEAYNQELAMGLRNKRPPGTGYAQAGSYIAALYTAATDAKYYPSLDAYEKQRAALEGNPTALADIDSQWAQYVANLSNANPIWAANRPSKNPQLVQTATIALQQLTSAVDNPKTPASPQTALVKTLVDSYNGYLAAREGIQLGTSEGTLTDLKNQFNDYLDNYTKANPAATAVVSGVFRRLVDASS